MKNAVFAVIAALCLAGCASNSQVAEKALGNLSYCKRTYQAALGGMGVPGGSLYIECAPQPFPAAAAE